MNSYSSRNIRFLDYPDKAAKLFWKVLEAKGYARMLFGAPMPFFPGVMVSKTIIRSIFHAGTTLRENFSRSLTDEQILTSRLKSRVPTLLKRPLNVPAINAALITRIKEGYGLPLVFDSFAIPIMRRRMKFVSFEFQSAIGYLGRAVEISDCARRVYPILNDLQSEWNDPISDVRSLRQLSPFDHIHVFDIDSRISKTGAINSTRPDMNYFARLLGDSSSSLVCPLDLEKKGKDWFVKVRDEHLNIIRRERVTCVYSRSLYDEISILDRFLYSNRNYNHRLINEFYRDPKIIWIHHPAWQNLLDKRDLPMLGLSPSTKPFAIKTYTSGDHRVETGEYIIKPTNKSSGIGQVVISVANGTSLHVPRNNIAQPFVIPYPFPISVKSFKISPMIFGTLELRLFLMPTARRGLSTSGAAFLVRLAPRSAPGIEGYTKTNAADIYRAELAWLNLNSSSTNRKLDHKIMPFGLGSVFIF